MKTERKCIDCGTEIHECMGFVVAGDFLRILLGTSRLIQPREVCGKCVEIRNKTNSYPTAS